MKWIKSAFATTGVFVALSNQALGASASWQCEFPSFKEPMTFVTELGSRKGKLVGNVGTSDVWVVEGTGAISFLEPLLTGVVQVTTIILKTGEAAHSRNTLLSLTDDFMPSQTIGKCKPW
jgi:hypothetical protein